MSDKETPTTQCDRDQATSIFERHKEDWTKVLSIYNAAKAAAEAKVTLNEFSGLLDAPEALMNLLLTVVRMGDAAEFLAVDVEGVANIRLCDPYFLEVVITCMGFIYMICLGDKDSIANRQLVVYDIARYHRVDHKALRFVSGKHLWRTRARKTIDMVDFVSNISWILEATKTIFNQAIVKYMARGRTGIGLKWETSIRNQ